MTDRIAYVFLWASALHVYLHVFPHIYTQTLKNKRGAGKMEQWLRALAILAEDLGSIPSTHMATNICP